jgi:hypothetical protein
MKVSLFAKTDLIQLKTTGSFEAGDAGCDAMLTSTV